MRIVHVARRRHLPAPARGRGARRARSSASARAHAFDPEVAACLADDAAEILALDAEASAWDEVLACEPHPRLTLEGEAIDRALAAMGELRRPDLALPRRSLGRRRASWRRAAARALRV